MGIEIIDDLDCELCKEKILMGYRLHEFAPDSWTVVCPPCDDTLDLDEGK